MNRREFLMTTAGIAALGAGHSALGQSQGPNAQKLARIGMMTLNFTRYLKTPWQTPGPERTLELFDLPQMYVDMYGVRNIELQHYHLASSDPEYFRTLKERIARAGCKSSQLVVEFGGLNISAPNHNFLPRLQAIDLTKVWIDRCAVLECPRIMVNQGQPSEENRAMAVETLSAMVEYGRTKNVKVTLETRGGGEPAWSILNEIAKAAGAFINIDLGGIGATTQEELHKGLDALLPNTSGSMHVSLRQNVTWDLATALKHIESKGYTGIYSIESPGHERTRAIYDTILAAI